MDLELFATLELRIDVLLDRYAELQQQNGALQEENRRLLEERQGFKSRIDEILARLERI
jgi:cell division protein ZapB